MCQLNGSDCWSRSVSHFPTPSSMTHPPTFSLSINMDTSTQALFTTHYTGDSRHVPISTRRTGLCGVADIAHASNELLNDHACLRTLFPNQTRSVSSDDTWTIPGRGTFDPNKRSLDLNLEKKKELKNRNKKRPRSGSRLGISCYWKVPTTTTRKFGRSRRTTNKERKKNRRERKMTEFQNLIDGC